MLTWSLLSPSHDSCLSPLDVTKGTDCPNTQVTSQPVKYSSVVGTQEPNLDWQTNKQTVLIQAFKLSRRQNSMQFSRQRAATICEGFPTFRELPASQSSGCAGGLVEPQSVFLFNQTTSTPWRWRQNWFPKCRKTFIYWPGCLPEKISLKQCWSVDLCRIYWQSVGIWQRPLFLQMYRSHGMVNTHVLQMSVRHTSSGSSAWGLSHPLILLWFKTAGYEFFTVLCTNLLTGL